MTMRGYLSKENTIDLKAIKGGPQRIVVPVTSGFIRGTGPAEGLEAEILPSSGDWLLLDTSTGTAHLDVRVSARTPAGEGIYIHYLGHLKINEAAEKVFEWSPDAKSTQFGDLEFWCSPNIETGSDKFKWVEAVAWVGRGRFVVDEKGTAVEHQIHRARH